MCKEKQRQYKYPNTHQQIQVYEPCRYQEHKDCTEEVEQWLGEEDSVAQFCQCFCHKEDWAFKTALESIHGHHLDSTHKKLWDAGVKFGRGDTNV